MLNKISKLSPEGANTIADVRQRVAAKAFIKY